MATRTRVWTPDEVRAMQREELAWPRYELVDGELLVTPSPRPYHALAVLELLFAIRPFVKEHGLGIALMSPADIDLDGRSVLQPDVFVVPPGHLVARPDREPAWSDVKGLLLAVEVLSSSTARRDRGVKRHYYQRHGVAEYWIVDLDARLVERWRPLDERPEVVSAPLTWQPDASRPALAIDLATLSAEVLDGSGTAPEG